jgi:hypothetical protein
LRIDPGAKHRLIDRLRDEIIRARFEAEHLAFLATVARQHDRGQLRDVRIFVPPELSQNLCAVQSGHVVIEQQQTWQLGVQQLQRFASISAFAAAEAGGGERPHQQAPAHRIVIYHQNVFRASSGHDGYHCNRKYVAAEPYFSAQTDLIVGPYDAAPEAANKPLPALGH